MLVFTVFTVYHNNQDNIWYQFCYTINLRNYIPSIPEYRSHLNITRIPTRRLINPSLLIRTLLYVAFKFQTMEIQKIIMCNSWSKWMLIIIDDSSSKCLKMIVRCKTCDFWRKCIIVTNKKGTDYDINLSEHVNTALYYYWFLPPCEYIF